MLRKQNFKEINFDDYAEEEDEDENNLKIFRRDLKKILQIQWQLFLL